MSNPFSKAKPVPAATHPRGQTPAIVTMDDAGYISEPHAQRANAEVIYSEPVQAQAPETGAPRGTIRIPEVDQPHQNFKLEEMASLIGQLEEISGKPALALQTIMDTIGALVTMARYGLRVAYTAQARINELEAREVSAVAPDDKHFNGSNLLGAQTTGIEVPAPAPAPQQQQIKPTNVGGILIGTINTLREGFSNQVVGHGIGPRGASGIFDYVEIDTNLLACAGLFASTAHEREAHGWMVVQNKADGEQGLAIWSPAGFVLVPDAQGAPGTAYFFDAQGSQVRPSMATVGELAATVSKLPV